MNYIHVKERARGYQNNFWLTPKFAATKTNNSWLISLGCRRLAKLWMTWNIIPINRLMFMFILNLAFNSMNLLTVFLLPNLMKKVEHFLHSRANLISCSRMFTSLGIFFYDQPNMSAMFQLCTNNFSRTDAAPLSNNNWFDLFLNPLWSRDLT